MNNKQMFMTFNAWLSEDNESGMGLIQFTADLFQKVRLKTVYGGEGMVTLSLSGWKRNETGL